MTFHDLRHISIHKALASLDNKVTDRDKIVKISIHKALASLDIRSKSDYAFEFQFQSTRLSRASTVLRGEELNAVFISIHKALASLDLPRIQGSRHQPISIHKALASLDSKIIQTYSTSPLTFYALCSFLPSSTNSVHSPSPLSRPFPLFFRCESPWHFMLAWHSHLV